MIYTTNPSLPSTFKSDNGLKLCMLWFSAEYGMDITKENLEKYDGSDLIIEEASQYLILYPEGEILKIDGHYFVGDGYGRPIYSPTRRNMEDYLGGNARLEQKFSVKKKTS